MNRLTSDQQRRLREQRRLAGFDSPRQPGKPACVETVKHFPSDEPPASIDDDASARSVTIDEACKLLACSARTLWRAVDRGELPEPFRLGRKSAWALQALLSFRVTASRRRRRRPVDRVRNEHGQFIGPPDTA